MKKSVPFLLVAFLALLAGQTRLLAQDEEGGDSENYSALFQKGIKALESGHSQEGVDLFKKCMDLQPGDPISPYNVACGYAQMKQKDEAMKYLGIAKERGLFDRRLGQDMIAHMAKDSDMDNLRDSAEYKAFIEEEVKRRKAETEQSVLETFYKTYRYEGFDKDQAHPLLIVLHEEGSNAYTFIEEFHAFADQKKWLVVAVQGSIVNPNNQDQTAWDVAIASDAVVYVLGKIQARYKIDASRVVLCGVGQGGLVAIQTALRHPGKFPAVVNFCGTAIPEMLKPDLSKENAGKVAVALLQAKDDDARVNGAGLVREMAQKSVELLAKEGFRAKYTEYDGPRGMPRDRVAQLDDAIAWACKPPEKTAGAPEKKPAPAKKPEPEPAPAPATGEDF
ncbi:MAG: hypothetical protein HY719_16760 [Planctomycetes bacterium]|nr:hypothetical protein [Planctomycetota bacterium]